jgi:hypothetical protein
MESALPLAVAEMLDREMIRDVVMRYSRAVDRRDFEALRQVYWPEAIDDHGAYNGPVAEFFDWVDQRTRNWDRTVHNICQIIVDLKGAEAGVETYFMAYHKKPRPDGGWFDELVGGRYVDRMVKRNGEWRILHRIVLFEWFRHFSDSFEFEESPWRNARRGARKPDDVIYSFLGDLLA